LVRDLHGGAEHRLGATMVWPRWSPDERWIAGSGLDADRGFLVVCPAQGGACRQLTKGREPHWSADGRQLYFLRYLGTYDVRTSKPVDLMVIGSDGAGERPVAQLEGPHPVHFFYDVSSRGEVAWCEFVPGKEELWIADLEAAGAARER